MKTIINIPLIFYCLIAMSWMPLKVYAQVTIGITVRDAPPELPVYDQPECPVDGYLWEPGYWAYGDDGYYWVPGVWVNPPQYGYLWTPCYWGFSGGLYGFYGGYWGPHVGYYGGVNYGFGYGGSGYYGGRWEGRHFRYNTAVVNVNRSVIHNTYADRSVISHNSARRSSFNGPGGVRANPTAQEKIAIKENHVQFTPEQSTHQKGASTNRSQFSTVNKGHPATTAVNKVNQQSENHQMTKRTQPVRSAPVTRPSRQTQSHGGGGGGHASGRHK